MDFHALLQQDPRAFLDKLCENILLGSDYLEHTMQLFKLMVGSDKTHLLQDYRDQHGDSLLHLVAKFHQKPTALRLLIRLCPDLLTVTRHDQYEGQTALHIVISKGNLEAVEAILKHKNALEVRKSLLKVKATGSRFTNTVMMGELPLSVAALTLDANMTHLLIDCGADISCQNDFGDTVFHSLIKFAYLYPEKTQEVRNMILTLHDKMVSPMTNVEPPKLTKQSDYALGVWFLQNNDYMTPLKLAASLGQVDLFSAILELDGVYRRLDQHDGLFDIHSYDITEIDTIAQSQWAKKQHKKRPKPGKVTPVNAVGLASSSAFLSNEGSFITCCRGSALFDMRYRSVLEIICEIDVHKAFDLVNHKVVKNIVKDKWVHYNKGFYTWAFSHVAIMCLLTVYAMDKTKIMNSKIFENQNTSLPEANLFTNPTTSKLYVDVCSAISMGYSTMHLIFELIRLLVLRQSLHLKRIHHNGLYRLVLGLFSLCMNVDSVWFHIKPHNNFLLIPGLLLGWGFTTFFLRPHKKFSFFTVMFLKVLFGDMLRFSTIIILELLSFSVAMHITFLQSRPVPDDFEHLGVTTLTMFKLMLGLTDIEILYKARHPWVAITLFVFFVLITYVLLVNSLIAMMSQTCSMVSEDRHTQWELQRLSVILFLESMMLPFSEKNPKTPGPTIKIICRCSPIKGHLPGTKKHIRRFDHKQQQTVQEARYFTEVTSMQTKYTSGEAIIRRKSVMRTMGFNQMSILMENMYQNQNYQNLYKNMSPMPESLSTIQEKPDYDKDDYEDIDDGVQTKLQLRNYPQQDDKDRYPFEMFGRKTGLKKESKEVDATKTAGALAIKASLSPRASRKRHSSDTKNRRTQTDAALQPLSRSYPEYQSYGYLNIPNSQRDNYPGAQENQQMQILALPALPSSDQQQQQPQRRPAIPRINYPPLILNNQPMVSPILLQAPTNQPQFVYPPAVLTDRAVLSNREPADANRDANVNAADQNNRVSFALQDVQYASNMEIFNVDTQA